MVVIGAGLLWFGWFGFNAGSAVASDALAPVALLNTNVATAVAALSWMFVEWLHALGLASGAIAGLVAITPAAGFVNVIGAIIIGLVAGAVPYFADVFGIHGVAGILGAVVP
jgi:Amt family ammonium transporter